MFSVTTKRVAIVWYAAMLSVLLWAQGCQVIDHRERAIDWLSRSR